MRKLKRIAAVCLTAAMTLSLLAGCGGSGTGDTTTESTTGEVTETTTEADTTEEASSEEATEEEEELGVSDGDRVIDITFDDGENGGFHTYTNGGNEELLNENGELCVDIKKTGSIDYANQIYYDGFRLYQGCVYEYSFDVRCDIERNIEWRLQINGGDYHAYASEVIDIGPETQHITATFTMEEDSDPAPRLCFNMGKQEGMTGEEAEHHIYFDNVLLEAVDASGAQQVEAVPDPIVVNVNQVGYKKNDTKVATVIGKDAKTFEVIDAESGEAVYSGNLTEPQYDAPSGEYCQLADFSEVTEDGTYKVTTDTDEESFEFQIGDDVYSGLYNDIVLMLYNQRCGVELDSSISGEFAHAACHTGEAVVYGTDTKIDVTGGWHDAGDYGRYVVSGAKTVADLFLTYEDAGYTADDVGIPESGNGVPDILDEARYELDWMLKMQDSASGGVYHKVTCAVFPETVMPEEETAELIASPISNTATGDFAAVMAKASVLYKEYDADFAAICLEAAKKAFEYFTAHEGDNGFKNPDDIVTGEYPDGICRDEYLWAAVELYAATGDKSYKTAADAKIEGEDLVNYDLGWADVGYYALYDYIQYDGGTEAAKEKFLHAADKTVKEIQDSGFGVWVSGTMTFAWGSNMTIANKGMLLLMANNIEPNADYVKYAAFQRDYLLGRNSVSYCYVTGYGTRSPLYTHHRPSQVLETSMPGMLVGGSNSNLEDPYAQAVLMGKAPESCYADNAQSFSCNEITIYWNSPLIYLMAKLDSVQ